MKGETVRVLLGFILGLSVVVLLGATHEVKKYEAIVSGGISTSTITYQSAFSGITPEGVCYLAITNTQNGCTDVFKVTEDLCDLFGKNAFQQGHQGRVIAVPKQ